ncbi:MAG: hypothetical protein AAFY57_09305 [Cyanobacteria bacterium J06642_2]
MAVDLAANEVEGLEYVVLGVATCFRRGEDGRLQEIRVAEPIPAAELDCLFQGVRSTSYDLVYATTYAEIVRDGEPTLPADIVPAGVFPCSNFTRRVQAAVRTFRAKPEFKHVPLHQTCTTDSGSFTLNYNPEPKRVLDVIYEPSEDDNVKQHAHTHAVL